MEYHQDQWANIVTWGLLQIWWCRQTDRQSYSIIRINQQKYTYIGFGEEMMFYTCPDKKGKSIERKNHLLHKRINIEEKTEEAFILFPKLKWQEQKQILKPSKNMWIFWQYVIFVKFCDSRQVDFSWATKFQAETFHGLPCLYFN